MPTTLPRKRSTTLPMIFWFFLSLWISAVVIELVDPASFDVEAAWMTAP